MGGIYQEINTEKSLHYHKKALEYVEYPRTTAEYIQKLSVLGNIGNQFQSMRRFDSSLVYYSEAQQIILKDSSFNIGNHYYNLGSTYLGLNQMKLALTCFQIYLDFARRTGEIRRIRSAYFGLGKYYFKTGNIDSALLYYKQELSISVPGSSPSWQIDLSLSMYKIYKQLGKTDEALYYLEMHNAAKAKADSLADNEKVQSLSFEEDMRQQELEKEKAKKLEDRKHNLQYAGIASGLVTFIILFLLFSHSIIANQKLIRFLGVMALLIVFEFLNLLLHPYLDGISNHSPLLMLLAMVCIAALLIPLHHKIQHWVTHKLVEKNNRIRLAAAKKTIEKLEGRNDMQQHTTEL